MENALSRILSLPDNSRAKLMSRLIASTPADGTAPRTLASGLADLAPASAFQEQLLFFDRLFPGEPAYNVPFALRLRGSLDIEALANAITEITRRHEALRTTIDVAGSRIVQRVTPPAKVTLPLHDLPTSRQGSSAEQCAAELAREHARYRFRISEPPLSRYWLYRLGVEDHLLVWVAHHAVCDAESVGIFLRELAALYAPFADHIRPEMPDLPLQYGEFAAAEQRAWKSDQRLADLEHWRASLGSLADLDLPAQRPRTATPGFTGAQVRLEVPAAIVSRLEGLARRHRATMFMILMSAWQVVLCRSSGQTEFAVGTTVTGRRDRVADSLIGPFLNVVLIKADLADDPDCGQVLLRVRDRVLDALAHQEVPFRQLVGAIAGARNTARNPLTQTMCELASLPAGQIELDEHLTLTAAGIPNGVSITDIAIFGEIADGKLTGRVDFDTQLFDEITARGIVEDLRFVLDAFAAQPELRLCGRRTGRHQA